MDKAVNEDERKPKCLDENASMADARALKSWWSGHVHRHVYFEKAFGRGKTGRGRRSVWLQGPA